jgi:hypothetical protein
VSVWKIVKCIHKISQPPEISSGGFLFKGFSNKKLQKRYPAAVKVTFIGLKNYRNV